MRELYLECEPISTHRLNTDDGHSVYFEVCGNSEGIPVIFLHGGPGSGCNENHRRYFNPDKYRIVIFDQRGCNRSGPRGSIENNSTQAILSDMEAMREELGIEKWLVFGGSWGATLALLYAEQYPQSVSGIVLRGSFLARQSDLDWFIRGGVERIFPDAWAAFNNVFNASDKGAVDSVAEWVFSDDFDKQLQASKAWSQWAGRIVTASFLADYTLEVSDEQRLIDETRIEMHYALNRYFISDNQILNNIHNIPDVPVKIIHGRRDLTCLPESSWLLKQAMPQAELEIIHDAGHLAGETSMVDALIRATDDMAEKLQ